VFDVVKQFKSSGSTNPGKSPGRPRKTSKRADSMLRRIVIGGKRHVTTAELTKDWSDTIGVSVGTCRRRLHKMGFSYYKPKDKPLITNKQKKNRLSWAREHLNWSLEQWNHVVFSDESKFSVCYGDHRNTVIRNKKEAFHPHCLKRTVKFPDSIMVWGCMSSLGVGSLHFIEGTVNAAKYQSILQESLLPSVGALHPDGNFIFQEDGAPAHKAKTTQTWLRNHHINKLSWPSNSPDMSPIENIWGEMKKYIRRKKPRTKGELKLLLQEA
jgi:hypothetical protein